MTVASATAVNLREYPAMKTILIIGIGAGDPEYVTMQAVNALNRVDVFFIIEKGASKAKLIELREARSTASPPR